eukprot:591546-Amphidinium_carterae.1
MALDCIHARRHSAIVCVRESSPVALVGGVVVTSQNPFLKPDRAQLYCNVNLNQTSMFRDIARASSYWGSVT